MEPRSEKKKIGVKCHGSRLQAVRSEMWRLHAITSVYRRIHKHPMSLPIGQSVKPRTRPPGTKTRITSPGGLEASSGCSTQGEKHGNANGSCLWNAGR